MTPARRTAIGAAMLVAGVAMMLASAGVAWSAVRRWVAVADVNLAVQRQRAGDAAMARRLAAGAAAQLPGEPAPALLAADLSTAEGADRLAALLPGVADPGERRTVMAAVALSRVLRGKPADVDLAGTGDGRLLATLVTVRAGKTPGRMSGDGEDPPHAAVERAALVALMRHAWSQGDAEAVRRAGGALLLLAPRQAEAAVIATAVVAASAASEDEAVLAKAAELQPEVRDRAVRALAALVPARRAALAARFPKAFQP